MHVLDRTFISLRSRNMEYPLSIEYVKRTLNSPAAKDREERTMQEAMLAKATCICDETDASLVQHIDITSTGKGV